VLVYGTICSDSEIDPISKSKEFFTRSKKSSSSQFLILGPDVCDTQSLSSPKKHRIIPDGLGVGDFQVRCDGLNQVGTKHLSSGCEEVVVCVVEAGRFIFSNDKSIQWII
jgi:hypothetical protein